MLEINVRLIVKRNQVVFILKLQKGTISMPLRLEVKMKALPMLWRMCYNFLC